MMKLLSAVLFTVVLLFYTISVNVYAATDGNSNSKQSTGTKSTKKSENVKVKKSLSNSTSSKSSKNTKQAKTAKSSQKKNQSVKKAQTTTKKSQIKSKQTAQKTVNKKETKKPANAKKSNKVLNTKNDQKTVNTVKLVPMSGAAYTGLLVKAQSLYETKKYDEALKAYKEAYNAKREAFVAINIVSIMMEKGDKNCVDAIDKYNINDPKAIGRLIIGLADRKQIREAERLVAETKSIRDNGDIAFAQGYLNEIKGDVEIAAKFYKQAFLLNEMDPIYVYSYARMFDRVKDYDNASKYYQSTIDLSPGRDIMMFCANRIDAIAALQTKKPTVEVKK